MVSDTTPNTIQGKIVQTTSIDQKVRGH